MSNYFLNIYQEAIKKHHYSSSIDSKLFDSIILQNLLRY